ncbi:DUF3991 and toprim domain-containing protein [Pelotomaculum terephthalicicum JT]|uniref:DUF3991 and TOPRIM domain-containing protein n=1 Tax=Pelotomaculum terephthalicicum TaxID=206393 RepID=UPI001F0457FB|nr:DUF3991 and TOPRIM domain-containing protein [Pelotomaculum terephthalicicum]MCG9969601.1 DUF3991 and toprim domain-containing protein [Pelotomaculum terephthalicicum JT]
MVFSREMILKARRADLLEYLRSRGYELKKEGKNWRAPGYGGLVIRGNRFYHFSGEIGGNALDFCIKFLRLPFWQAVLELNGSPAAAIERPVPRAEKKLKKVLEMPARFRNEHRVIAYLTKTRCLPAGMVVDLIRIGLLYQDDKGNCVFVCRDEAGRARGAILAGTVSNVRWKGVAPGSDTGYGWWWPADCDNADTVIPVESPIDAVSFVVLYPEMRESHILALGGLHTEALEGFLKRVKIGRVVLALDSDIWGRKAALEWGGLLSARGYEVREEVVPEDAKDWNNLLRMNQS